MHQPSDLEAIAEIERSTRHLDRLVGKLIAAARAEENAIRDESRRARADLLNVAADAMSLLAPVAATNNVELALESDVDRAFVGIEPSVLHDILTNLIDNAISYNKAGGSVTVQILRSSAKRRTDLR